jgi:hypothetical protein
MLSRPVNLGLLTKLHHSSASYATRFIGCVLDIAMHVTRSLLASKSRKERSREKTLVGLDNRPPRRTLLRPGT